MKTSFCDGEDMFQKHTITSLPPELRMPSHSTGKSQPRDPLNELMQLSLPRGGEICICYKMLAILQALYIRTAARKVRLIYMHYTEANFHLVSQFQACLFSKKKWTGGKCLTQSQGINEFLTGRDWGKTSVKVFDLHLPSLSWNQRASALTPTGKIMSLIEKSEQQEKLMFSSHLWLWIIPVLFTLLRILSFICSSSFLFNFYHYFYMLTNVLFYVSSAINPILYNLVSANFRQIFLSTLTLVCLPWRKKKKRLAFTRKSNSISSNHTFSSQVTRETTYWSQRRKRNAFCGV